MASSTRHEARKRRVFNSIFPPPSTSELPTPLATPAGSFTAGNHGLAPPLSASPLTPQTQFSRTSLHNFSQTAGAGGDNGFVAHNRAWHLATSFLSFPDCSFDTVEEGNSMLDGVAKDSIYVRRKKGMLGRETKDAINYLMKLEVSNQAAGGGSSGRNRAGVDSLVEWYTAEARRHFLAFVKPLILEEVVGESPEQHLNRILIQLKIANRIYTAIYEAYLLPHIARDTRAARRSSVLPAMTPQTHFRRSIASIISFSMPPVFPTLLYKTFHAYLSIILSLPNEEADRADAALFASPHIPSPDMARSADLDLDLDEDEKERLVEEEGRRRKEEARAGLQVLVGGLEDLGLMGNAIGERVFAGAVDVIVGEWVCHTFAGVWQPPDDISVVSTAETRAGEWAKKTMDKWLTGTLMPLVTSVLAISHPPSAIRDPAPNVPALFNRLSALRITEIFDMIVDYPSSLSGFMDLAPSLLAPGMRQGFASSASVSLAKRLLHPGASTVDILRAYLSMIKAFKTLDPKGVLLDRVGARIRRYLGQRDDTTLEIVRGILADNPDDENSDDDEESGESTAYGSDSDDVGEISYMTDMTDGSMAGYRGPAGGGGNGGGGGGGGGQYVKIDDDVTDEDENLLRELGQELMSNSHSRENPASTTAGLEDLDFDDMEWQPDPVDAGPEYRKHQGTDIISHMLTLHSNEAFIREFQKLLGARLLAATLTSSSSYSSAAMLAKETQVLELLKLRFTEAPLQSCAVMLRDIAESRRIDLHVRSEQQLEFLNPQQGQQQQQQRMLPSRRNRTPSPDSLENTRGNNNNGTRQIRAPEVHAKILSRMYWPSTLNDEDDFNLPPEIDNLLKRYSTGFENLKKSRKLKWLKAEGKVRVDLELQDRKLSFRNISPACASVIYTFAQHPPNVTADVLISGSVRWSIEQLVQHLNMEEEMVRKSVSYWCGKGVLDAAPPPATDTFYVVESLEGEVDDPFVSPKAVRIKKSTSSTANKYVSSDSDSSDDDDDSGDKEDKEKKAKAAAVVETKPTVPVGKQAVVWQFIVGMLTNLGVMGSGRIIEMLRMMLPDGVDFGVEELEEFLQSKAEEGKVENKGGGVVGEGGGMWKLKAA